MLKILIFSLFVSSAFAGDVNEISGTFFSDNGKGEEMQKQETPEIDIYSVNSFSSENGTRLPASSTKDDHQSVNELTGTFE